MNFDWKLYIQLSEELINSQKNLFLQEAYYRSAISRSYYGVYCIARNFLAIKGINIPKVDTHRFVRDEYMKSPNKTERKIGNALQNLLIERKDADYENNAIIDKKRAETAYQLSLRVLSRLSNLGAI